MIAPGHRSLVFSRGQLPVHQLRCTLGENVLLITCNVYWDCVALVTDDVFCLCSSMQFRHKCMSTSNRPTVRLVHKLNISGMKQIKAE